MSERTQQQKCTDLARKMGWKLEQDGYWQQWRSADGKKFCSVRPSCDESPIGNPYESADDKDALVAWLAKQSGEIWGNFSASVIDSAIPFDQQAYADWEMITRAVMTAPREIIADAAWLAITSAEQPKAS